MRWIDKPRKKTRKEVVLEYIKFMKVMGYYDSIVAYMYHLSNDDRAYVHIRGQYQEAKILCHKQSMIEYFETQLRNHCRSTLTEWVIRDYFIRYPLRMRGIGLLEVHYLTQLLFSYFKEKHIDNCILVD
jgi:hypothetical protein